MFCTWSATVRLFAAVVAPGQRRFLTQFALVVAGTGGSQGGGLGRMSARASHSLWPPTGSSAPSTLAGRKASTAPPARTAPDIFGSQDSAAHRYTVAYLPVPMLYLDLDMYLYLYLYLYLCLLVYRSVPHGTSPGAGLPRRRRLDERPQDPT